MFHIFFLQYYLYIVDKISIYRSFYFYLLDYILRDLNSHKNPRSKDHGRRLSNAHSNEFRDLSNCFATKLLRSCSHFHPLKDTLYIPTHYKHM